jgi:hypothetical protein
MASRRASGPFALSPLQGGRRAVRRRRTPGPLAIALAVVILGAMVFAAVASLH